MNKMNELDLTTKIEGLKKAIKEHNDFSATYQNDLAAIEKQLADINKPAITPMVMDEISEAIESAVEDFDFSDDGNFETEFELDYDNRIRLSNMDFTNSHELVAEIAEKVLELFQEAECPEDETTTDNS
tara:strand:- start:88 stop:474 length:387 start_codon:yes stop_codon:yes gene_type:complete